MYQSGSVAQMINISRIYRQLGTVKKSALWFTVCNMVLKGVSLIFVPLFAFYLSDFEYGKLSVYHTFEQVFLILGTWEISIGAFQRGYFKYRKDADVFRSICILFSNAAAMVLAFVYFIFYAWLYPHTQISLSLFVLMTVYYVVRPGYESWLTEKKICFDYKKAAAATLFYGILTVAVPFIGIRKIAGTADIKFSLQLLCSVLFFLSFYITGIKNGLGRMSWSKSRKYIGFILRYEPPLVFHSLSFLALGSADRVMISELAGNAQAGYYSIAGSLASVLNIVESSIAQVMTPWIYVKMDEEKYADIKKAVNFIAAVIALMVILFVLAAPEAVKILFKEEFHEAIWCIPPIAGSTYFIFLYSVYVCMETYFEVTKYIAYVSVGCAFINMILNYFLIGIFGYIICGYTTLFSYILFSVLHYAVAKIECRKRKEHSLAVDSRFLSGTGLFFLCGMIAASVFYESVFVRYSMIFTILFLIMAFKNKIIKHLKSLGIEIGT